MGSDPYERYLKHRGVKIPSPRDIERRYEFAFDSATLPEGTLQFGSAIDSGSVAWMMPEELRFGLHVYGGPGQGKSNGLKYLGRQLLARNQQANEALIFLDPHGEAAAHVLDLCIERGIDPERVIYCDLKEGDWIPVLNPLRPEGGIVRMANGLVQAITRAFGLEFMMENPLTAETMVNTAIVLLEKGYSLAETTYFIHNTPENLEVRSHLVEGSSVADFWEEIAELPKKDRRYETASAGRRFNFFLKFPHLKHMFGQIGPGIDFGRIMEEGGIALFNLSLHGTKLTEQAQRFVGALILEQIKAAALRRRKNESTPVHVLVDEFSYFTSYDTMEALAEARGFGIRLVLAHQRMDQLMMSDQDPRLLQAVLSIPNKLIFGAGLVDDQLQLSRQVVGPWVDLQKRKLEIWMTSYRPILKKVLLRSQAIASTRSASSGRGESSGASAALSAGTMTGPDSFEALRLTEQSVSASSSGASHFDAEGHADSRAEGVHEGYVTEHEAVQQLTNVQFWTPDEQIFEKMQDNIRRGVGSSLFVRGYQQPPTPVELPEEKRLAVSDERRTTFLQRMHESHRGSFLPQVTAAHSIVERQRKLVEAATGHHVVREPGEPVAGVKLRKPFKPRKPSTDPPSGREPRS